MPTNKPKKKRTKKSNLSDIKSDYDIKTPYVLVDVDSNNIIVVNTDTVEIHYNAKKFIKFSLEDYFKRFEKGRSY